MKLSDQKFTKEEIALADFSKAIALPVRIRLLRIIIENDNEASREALHSYFDTYNPMVINQHLLDLIHLNVIQSKRYGRRSSFSLNENFVVVMYNNFLELFAPLGKLNEAANAVIDRQKLAKKKKPVVDETVPPFGKFIQARRKALKLTQEEFSKLFGIDRAHFSKIETGGKLISTNSLPRLAECLEIPLAELEELYNNDKMKELSKKRTPPVPEVLDNLS
ncbi:MAG: helix-turn-helix transcriptional regulator [Bacteroidota bacterium]